VVGATGHRLGEFADVVAQLLDLRGAGRRAGGVLLGDAEKADPPTISATATNLPSPVTG
jgi:hypothetical protein